MFCTASKYKSDESVGVYVFVVRRGDRVALYTGVLHRSLWTIATSTLFALFRSKEVAARLEGAVAAA